jgi:predicted anti-sigma-YlaC factor YlaD
LSRREKLVPDNMNCRSAQRLLSAERDGALTSGECTALEAHLAECADCRRFRATVADAAEAWRASAARMQAPDADLAWQAVRREIRSGRASVGARSAPWFSRWMLPVGMAAALVAAVILVAPHRRPEPAMAKVASSREMARADFVDVGVAASPMVYVDDKSGWLVVWATDDQHPKNG